MARTKAVAKTRTKKPQKPLTTKRWRKKKIFMTNMSQTGELTEDQIDILKAREDKKNSVKLEITRPMDASILEIYIKAPILAEVIRKFVPGNFDEESVAPIYRPIIDPLVGPDGKRVNGRIRTRPGIARVTKNFAPAADFNWAEPPRTILLANPDKLAEGYKLTYKVEAPVPPEQLRRWGKMFMDGCNDIISNARPFKMAWILSEVPNTGEK